jgi:predicted amidohydrolase
MVLPELFNTGYAFADKRELEKLAEPAEGGNTIERLARSSAETGTTYVAGFAEAAGGKFYNSAAVVSGGELVGVYRKTHLFYKEKFLFEPGDTGFRVFDVGKAKVGVMICFDWIFPEAARVLALKGAQVIAMPANLVLAFAPKALPVRALENKVFTVLANRIGAERRRGLSYRFTGRSQIASPRMEILAQAGAREECVKVVEVDVALANKKRVTELNDLFEDRRPEFYSAIIERKAQ